MCTCLHVDLVSSLHFHASIRKNTQSPRGCVRKLANFHKKCDWQKLDRELLMNQTIGFHEKYSCVHVFLVSANFPLHFTQMHTKKAQRPRCSVRELENFHRNRDWLEMERVLPINPSIGLHEKYFSVHVSLVAANFLSFLHQ
jgi:hypothetical protein